MVCMLCLQVSLPVVRRFVQSVSDQAVGVGVIRGVRPDQQLVKVKSFSFTLIRSQGFKLRFLTLRQMWPQCGRGESKNLNIAAEITDHFLERLLAFLSSLNHHKMQVHHFLAMLQFVLEISI